MHPDFWLKRWESNDTPWHQSQPNEFLVHFFPKPFSGNVLVPLCGRSLDLLWLSRSGAEVFGIELSESATQSFFEEAELSYKIEVQENFKVYRAERIQIWVGDFFKLEVRHLNPIDFVYDRAALMALPQEMRKAYATRISQFQPAQMLIILKDEAKDLNDEPPFVVPKAELSILYEKDFELRELERRVRPSTSPQVSDVAYWGIRKEINQPDS